MSSSATIPEPDVNDTVREGQSSKLNESQPETPAIQSLGTTSVNSASAPTAPVDEERESNSTTKKSPTSGLIGKIKSRIPTYAQFKKTLKADIALTIALILVLAVKPHMVIGQGILLSCIAMIFFCPVKPVGLQLEVSNVGIHKGDRNKF